ncbi:hypothetical protein NUSPORA_00440 [Nucleospora cyclopteri]
MRKILFNTKNDLEILFKNKLLKISNNAEEIENYLNYILFKEIKGDYYSVALEITESAKNLKLYKNRTEIDKMTVNCKYIDDFYYFEKQLIVISKEKKKYDLFIKNELFLEKVDAFCFTNDKIIYVKDQKLFIYYKNSNYEVFLEKSISISSITENYAVDNGNKIYKYILEITDLPEIKAKCKLQLISNWVDDKILFIKEEENSVFAVTKNKVFALSTKIYKNIFLFDFSGYCLDFEIKSNFFSLLTKSFFYLYDLTANNLIKEIVIDKEIGKDLDVKLKEKEETDILENKRKTRVVIENMLADSGENQLKGNSENLKAAVISESFYLYNDTGIKSKFLLPKCTSHFIDNDNFITINNRKQMKTIHFYKIYTNVLIFEEIYTVKTNEIFNNVYKENNKVFIEIKEKTYFINGMNLLEEIE